jgi:hypothetical protein
VADCSVSECFLFGVEKMKEEGWKVVKLLDTDRDG